MNCGLIIHTIALFIKYPSIDNTLEKWYSLSLPYSNTKTEDISKMAQQWSPGLLFILAEEMLGLTPGYYTPEIPNYRMKLRIECKSGNVLVELDGQKVVLEKDATLRLTRTGEIANIHGPAFYLRKDEPLKAELAKSSFRQYMLQFHDNKVEVDYNCRAGVLGPSNSWNTVYGAVPKGIGKLAVVHIDDRSIHGKEVYQKFVVRENAKHDETVLQWFSDLAVRFPRRRSGAFDEALRSSWEPFLKKAAEDYYGSLPQQQIAPAIQPGAILQPA